MLTLKKIAITGGLSCGKSAVCHFLNELGAYVVSADEIVHQLLSVDKNLGQEIIKLLGNKIIVDQKIDRSVIAQIVFQDLKLLQKLEELLHPAVYKKISEHYHTQEKKIPLSTLFVAEIPLLFESGYQTFFDYTVVVMASEKVCIERFKKKSCLSANYYHERTSRQIPTLEKAKLADYVIVNNGNWDELKSKTLELYNTLTNI